MSDLGAFSAAEAAETAEWFLEYLADRGIAPPSGSPLERNVLATWDRAARILGGDDVPLAADGSQERLSDIGGIVELAKAVRAVRKHPEASVLDPHLAVLGQKSYLNSGPEIGQGRRASDAGRVPAFDPGADKIFELLVACYALRVGSDVVIDGGDEESENPDVLVTIDGKRWAFECKSLHSDGPEAFAARLKKAARQIYASDATHGTILLSLRTRTDPRTVWRMASGSPWPDVGSLESELRRQGERLVNNASIAIGSDALRDLLKGARKVVGLKGFATYTHGVGLIQGPASSVLTFMLRFFTFHNTEHLSDAQARVETAGIGKLNHAAQLCLRSNDPGWPTR